MNYRKLLFLTLLSVSFLLLGANQRAFSQAANPKETFEQIYQHWGFAVDKFKVSSAIGKEEYSAFSHFSEKSIDSLRSNFILEIGNGKVTLDNVKKYETVLEKGINSIYEKFKRIEQLYPSSVDEYRHYKAPFLTAPCDSACNNINFASGTLSGWNAYYGFNASTTTANDITNISGGPAGAVTHAANDTLTSTPGYYNAAAGLAPNPRPDYQVNITSGTRGDAIIPSIPVVSPFGGSYSVMLGDSSEVNYGVAMLTQTFLVGASNANFTYQYAIVLANPSSHNYYQQPYFTVAVLDAAGDTIPHCGEYNVVSGNGTGDFDSIPNYYDSALNESFRLFYKNWTIVNVPLKNYIGQCVTVVFQIVDCALGGHFGYAYIDASCSPLTVLSSSQYFCGQDSITLTGPAGEGTYLWTGPAGGIISSDTARNITIDSSGTYTLIVTPFTGSSCNDTLTVSIGKKAGPPPHPDFSADTGCAGLSTFFLNTSTPLSGADFYWDFYNDGIYEDSSVNATWTYNLPGTYQIKLQEFYNGCGADTVITIVIDSTVGTSFTADTVCYNDTTQFVNGSAGGITYYWNFGDPSSGANNTSLLKNPGHVFTAPGTYLVSLIAMHPGWCSDTLKKNIVVLPLPIATITGTGGDSLCYGASTVLTAGGGISYIWSTGATTSSITVNPTSPTIYEVTVSNGKCSKDTTYAVYIKPKLSGTLKTASVCLNDTVHLYATGGGTYLWSTGATTSSISVWANSRSDSTYSVTISNGGGSCLALDTSITIYPLPMDSVCCTDTIYAGNSVVLYGCCGSNYYWVPSTGLSCDTCPDPVASPTTTTTYTLVTTSQYGCRVTGAAVTVDVDMPCKDFFVPNVFTPNGDGINDTYLIQAEFMSYYEIWIYNRWGKLVFNSTNPADPWDGNIDGRKAAAGVYYYIIKATCFDGNYFKKDGYLQLIRDN